MPACRRCAARCRWRTFAEAGKAFARTRAAVGHNRKGFAGGIDAQIVTGVAAQRAGHFGNDARSRFD
jgi:hypothetical protein